MRLPPIAVALLLLVAAPGAFAAEPSPGYSVTELVAPRPLCCGNGIALDGDELYMNHAALDRLDRINVNSRSITAIAHEDDDAADELVTPDDIWRDPENGDLYVTEILTNGVRRIASDGTRTRVMTGFGDGLAHPNAIAGLRREGQPLRLFISMVQFEPGARTGIWEIDPAGVLPPKLVYGAAGGQTVFGHGMRAPNAFAFDPSGEELFVPETYGGAVYAVDVDARTARKVYDGASEASNGIAVRVARDGSLLYAEQSSGRLLRLDPAGPADQEPDVVAQLDPGIDGIAEHADGRIFLSNFRFGGLAVVHPDGSTGQLFPRSLDLPNGIAPLPSGGLAVADLGSLALVSPAGGISRPKQFIRDDFDIALGVALTTACDAYVTGFFRGTLSHVDLCDAERPHTEVLPRRSFAVGFDVAIEGDRAWVSDEAGLVHVVSGLSGSARASTRPLPTAFDRPTGLAVHDGRLYVAETDAGRVRVVDAETGLPLATHMGLDEPEGVAVEDDGSLLVVEVGSGELTRIGGTSGARETLLSDLDADTRGVSVVPVLNYLADVAVLTDGAIAVASPLDGSVRLVRPD